MDPNRFAELKDGQREVLRRMAAGRLIKQVAVDLGIAEITVHQRLAGAREILGVSSSREAARLFGEHERGQLYGPPIYSSIALPSAVASPPDTIVEAEHGASGERGQIAAKGGRTSPDFVWMILAQAWLPWRRGRPNNDMTREQRIGAITALMATFAIGGAIVAIAVVLLLSVLIYLSRHGA